MTDLSRFDGHTDGPWTIYSDGDIVTDSFHLIASLDYRPTNADNQLIQAAPKLLERVRELEQAMATLIEYGECCAEDVRLEYCDVKKILGKDWL